MAATQSNLSTRLKKQLDTVSGKIMSAEKMAEKQVKDVLSTTEKIRKEQLKNVQELMKEAKRLDSKALMRRAEKIKKEIETKASVGFAGILKTLNVPSSKELAALKRKVSTLEKKLKDLEKQKVKTTQTTSS